MRSRLAYLLAAAIVLPLLLPAQTRPRKESKSQASVEDSVARLIQADTLQLVEIRGVTYRKVKGHAKFRHNNTNLICDSALWNVDTKIINAMGRVKLEQDKTTLFSDKLTYYIDRDLAEFRGDVVRLVDKDGNTLKTKYLDYNTKDSIAVFRNGGAMRDRDGQVVESRTGTYDSKIGTFTFSEDVNMFSDSLFVKTSYLKYESEPNLATFGYNTNAWKDDNMLSANAGWYNRNAERFFFQRQVHVMTSTQEAWSDSLYFNRATNDVTMLGHVQVTDTTRNVFALAGLIDYVDSTGRTLLTRQPAVITETEETGEQGETIRDSLYFGADSIIYMHVRACDVDSLEKVAAAKRKASVEIDPVSELRKNAAEAARKAAEEAAANDPNNPENAKRRAEEAAAAKEKSETSEPKRREKPTAHGRKSDPALDEVQPLPGNLDEPLDSLAPALDSLATVIDSLALMPRQDEEAAFARDSLTTALDSLAARTDSLATALDSLAADADSLAAVEPLDTTKLGFVHAFRNVRMYRKSMQMVCDSLSYNDLDSLARLYYSPVIWNESARHQYCSDSVYAVVVDQKLQRANLLSNAFIHIQEDTLHYDQIKSTEMTAFFAEDNSLARFDALGGANALFYIEENGVLATANKKDCKMLSAIFNNGEIEKIYYFETAKSDAFPVVQMGVDERQLKGFSWSPEKRPKDRNDVTPLSLRPSERTRYSKVPEPKFVQTELYFPGYIGDIHRQIQVRDSLNSVRAERDRRNSELREQLREQHVRDSIAAVEDSIRIAIADSLALADAADSLASLAGATDGVADSLALASGVADTLSQTPALREEGTGGNSKDGQQALTPEQEAAKAKAEEAARKAALKAEKKDAAARKKAERRAALEKKWAEQDAKAEARAAAKKEKAAEKIRQKKLSMLQAEARQAARDEAKLEHWKERYRRKLERKNKK